jgi:predicted NUDIX family NTP pyrophosphohydrolase
MARKLSAGVVMYRRFGEVLQVLLVHPGGPYWAKKDLGSWSIPKGEYVDGEDPLAVAQREFEEETGFRATGRFLPLAPLRQPSGKVISAWACEGDCDASAIRSNTFSMEWPPRSGKVETFPEVDRAEWFSLEDARDRMIKGQRGFLDQLAGLVVSGPEGIGRDS